MKSSLEPLSVLRCRYGTAELLRGEARQQGRRVTVPILLKDADEKSRWVDARSHLESALERAVGNVSLVFEGDRLILVQFRGERDALRRCIWSAGMMLAYLEQLLQESAPRQSGNRPRRRDPGREPRPRSRPRMMS